MTIILTSTLTGATPGVGTRAKNGFYRTSSLSESETYNNYKRPSRNSAKERRSAVLVARVQLMSPPQRERDKVQAVGVGRFIKPFIFSMMHESCVGKYVKKRSS